MFERHAVPLARACVRSRVAVGLLAVLVSLCAGCNPFASSAKAGGASGAEATPSPAAGTSANEGSFDGAAVVKAVIDGDTIVAAIGSTEEHVRLLNIDTPETVDPDREPMCFGHEASEHTQSLLPKGTAIRLERDVELRDRYGRVLAFVYRQSDGLLVNLDLVSNGLADVMIIKPNGAMASKFTAAKAEAQAAGKGAWAGCPEPFER